MAIVNHAGGYMAPLRGGAGGRARRAIASCAGLFHRFHRLCGRKQRTRLHFVTRTTRGERHGKCGGDVIREFRDNHHVVFTEREPGGLDFAAELFDHGTYVIDAILWILNQRLQNLPCCN